MFSMTPTLSLLFHLCIISIVPSRTVMMPTVHEEMYEWTGEDEEEWKKT